MTQDQRPDDDNEVVNRSGNRPFDDVLSVHMSRRDVLVGGLAVGIAGFLPGAAAAAATRRGDGDSDGSGDRSRRADRLIGFAPVAVADGGGPQPAISRDYRYSVLIPWGEPIEPDGPAYRWPPTAADQALQIGIGHDGMVFFAMDGQGRPRGGGDGRNGLSSEHGMLAINHEFGRNPHVLGKPLPDDLDDVRVSQHAHGVSVVEIKRDNRGEWHRVKSPRARRIHANTPMTFSGPVAGHALLQTANGEPPLGTLNNCSCGETPWGTYLTCEENFNGYFGAATTDGAWTATPEQRRYGLSGNGAGYGWHRFDRRFDLADAGYRNEENRFGWVVEIDPWDAAQTPVKRTALGRFKHEGATTVVGRGGRTVVYMGDDQRFDYIYRFVSAGDWETMRRRGHSPLDRGTLYVARFDDDGSGEWLALDWDSSAILQRHFADQAEVLTFARLAADRLGATPMDRPEWISVDPGGVVYCSLTNNSRRTVANAANPLAPNPDGHIIRWQDSDRHTGRTFRWEIFLIAADTHGTEDTFSDPDGIYADPDGRLFIETDGDQQHGLNNQLLVADTRTGELRRLFTGVSGDEITGLAMTPDRRTLFINSQHPGRGDPAATNFPAPTDGVTVPRDATIVITRKDGGIVGS